MLVTFAISFVVGLVLLVLAMVGLDAVGAPTWVVVLPWLVPTAGVLAWTLWRPRPTDRHDDDHGWVDYATTRVLVGEHEPRSAPMRAVLGVVFGGPIGWMFLVGLALELTGVF